MITIIKQELDIDESLKTKLSYICEFANTTPTFIKGNIRKLDKTNLTYIEPHRIIIKGINFLFFNYSATTEIYPCLVVGSVRMCIRDRVFPLPKETLCRSESCRMRQPSKPSGSFSPPALYLTIFSPQLLYHRVKPSSINMSLIQISEPTKRTPNSYADFCLKKKKQEN